MKFSPTIVGYTASRANLTNIQERDKALHSVHCRVKIPPSQKHHPLFLASPQPPHFKSGNYPSPLFRQSPAIYWFFLTPPKTQIFL